MKKASAVGVVFVLSLGSLLHFVYDWSGGMPLVGVFGAVNESIWEHLKLLFWPMLLFGVIEWFWFGRRLPAFLPIRALSIVGGMAAITALYYTYSGVVGAHYLWADLLVYLLAVVGAYAFSLRFLQQRGAASRLAQVAAVSALLLCATAFAVFTFAPPALALFAPPQ